MVLDPKKITRIEATETTVSVYMERGKDDGYEPEIRIECYTVDDGYDEIVSRVKCTYFDGKQAIVI